MESRGRDKDALGRAAKTIAERGRVYKIGPGGKYRQVQYFTTSRKEATLIKRYLGGNYYPHLVGYTWAISSREGIKRLLLLLAPYIGPASRLNELKEESS